MAALAGSRMLGAKTLNVAVATLQAIDNEQRTKGTPARSRCLRRPFHPRPHAQHFESSPITFACVLAKSSQGVVVPAAGKSRRAPLVSSPTPSVGLPLQAVPTQGITAPTRSFERNVQTSVVSNERNIQTGAEIYKDKPKEAEEVKQWIEEIRAMFRSMTDGETTASPYDTAWVALVPALDGSDGPQFPKSLEWLVENQLPDGSWGDKGYFLSYERVYSTLACIIALKTWKTGSTAVEKGVKFIQKNLQGLETEADAHMVAGFEIVFPAMMSSAKSLELDLPYNAPFMSKIYIKREKKLAKIPIDILHKVPTTLLYSLEGFHEEGLDWEKLLKLQNEDGSFLGSAASTAVCLLHTKDEKALGYLKRLLDRFNNAVPTGYPIDLIEHLWIVDRLQRLGIDRYFEKEIKDCLDYVYKRFTSFGIGWTGGATVQDLDDTAMGFRLLRQHGYDVNEDVFRQFKGEDSEFFCFAGQLGQGVSDIFNFYRATQTRFPGETLLEAGEHFARGFLEDRLEKKECFDKWVISKDLPGEVRYALATPWYCSLPQLETQAYLSQYGPDDVWIAKTLYRMPFVHNETFLSLAKADFNLCQAKHQEDLKIITRWSEDCGFGKVWFAREKSIEALFSAVCVFPYPEESAARLVWAQVVVLTTVVDDYFDVGGNLPHMRRFVAAFKEWNPSQMDETAEEAQIVFNGLYNTLNAMTQEGTLAQGRDIGQHVHKFWLKWLEAILTEAEWTASAFLPSFDEYMNDALITITPHILVPCCLLFFGDPINEEFFSDPKFLRLMDLTSHVGRLLNDIQTWKRETSQHKPNAVSILLRDNSGWTEEEVIAYIRTKVEESMLELVREVHQQSHIPKSIRQFSFNTARQFQLFYQKTDGYTDSSAMAKKLNKVLFEPVTV